MMEKSDSRASITNSIRSRAAMSMNGAKIKNGGGPRIRVPPGDTVTSMVRYGMCLKIRSALKAADAIKMHKRAFIFVRKLLLLKDRDILSAEETATVDQALAVINAERRLAPAQAMVKEILDRHWRPHTMQGSNETTRKATAKVRKQFDKTLFMIRETCTNNEEMRLPLLTSQEREEATKTLVESIAGLSEMLNKIQRGGTTR